MEKINRIFKIVSMITTLKKEWEKVNAQIDTENSPGKKKALIIHEKYLYKKILFYIEKLRALIDIKSSVAIVEIQGRTKKMLFNGLNKEEVITYLEGMRIITNQEIIILEISEIDNQVEEI